MTEGTLGSKPIFGNKSIFGSKSKISVKGDNDIEIVSKISDKVKFGMPEVEIVEIPPRKLAQKVTRWAGLSWPKNPPIVKKGDICSKGYGPLGKTPKK